MKIFQKCFLTSTSIALLLSSQSYASDIMNLKIQEDDVGNKIMILHTKSDEGYSIRASWKSIYDANWNESSTISGDETHPSHPTLVMNKFGNLVLVWVGFDTERNISRLYSSFAPSIGGAWSKPKVISDETHHVSSKYEFKPTQDEQLILVWSADLDEKKYLFHSTGQFDGSWSAPEQLPFNP